MAPDRLPIEIEVGPRFEIFYALHALFAPATSGVQRWRETARRRLGARVIADALDVAPEPLMWAILGDAALAAGRVGSFEDLMEAIENPTPASFKSTIISGIPTVRGSDIAGQFELLLRDPEAYRLRLTTVLRAFWSRGFADDFAALLPELRRVERRLLAATAQATIANAGSKLGIPIHTDESADSLTAGRGGYTVPLARVARVLVLPSAFNFHRWWTKRDDGNAPAELFFPINDGTIVPNDAVRDVRAGGDPNLSGGPSPDAKAAHANLRPELVFRALGDTTRYAIATILARAPTTPTDLSRQLRVSKPTITHHIHALRNAGLIVDGAEGGKLALDRSKLEQLSAAAVAALFASEGKLKLSKTRKRVR